MTIKEIQNEIIEDFALFDDWLDKYEYIIELGNELDVFDEKNKIKSNLIPGCQSRVWLDAKYKDGKVIYSADSDAIITKGVISLLIKLYSNQTPDEILETEPYFIGKTGLQENLSPTRANGLVSMIKKIKSYAAAYKIKND